MAAKKGMRISGLIDTIGDGCELLGKDLGSAGQLDCGKGVDVDGVMYI